jgi:hypothetical protein
VEYLKYSKKSAWKWGISDFVDLRDIEVLFAAWSYEQPY